MFFLVSILRVLWLVLQLQLFVIIVCVILVCCSQVLIVGMCFRVCGLSMVCIVLQLEWLQMMMWCMFSVSIVYLMVVEMLLFICLQGGIMLLMLWVMNRLLGEFWVISLGMMCEFVQVMNIVCGCWLLVSFLNSVCCLGKIFWWKCWNLLIIFFNVLLVFFCFGELDLMFCIWFGMVWNFDEWID